MIIGLIISCNDSVNDMIDNNNDNNGSDNFHAIPTKLEHLIRRHASINGIPVHMNQNASNFK